LATKAERLYFLQQCGPNAFLVGTDTPKQRFRVILGPQTCSCKAIGPCSHMLFILTKCVKLVGLFGCHLYCPTLRVIIRARLPLLLLTLWVVTAHTASPRVLKLAPTDPRVSAKSLQNFETEALVAKFEEVRLRHLRAKSKFCKSTELADCAICLNQMTEASTRLCVPDTTVCPLNAALCMCAPVCRFLFTLI
jgi:hypothetical protein